MPRLHPLEPDEAPSSAGPLLAGIIDRHGDAGPMVRTMATPRRCCRATSTCHGR